MKILIINGPNLNMLGIREPEIYGKMSYGGVMNEVLGTLPDGVSAEFVQSNSEGTIIDTIHRAHFEKYDGIIINPGAYTHYSYAIYDALNAVSVPCVEVHFSNISARDEFRKTSVTAPACVGQIAGFGAHGYLLAAQALLRIVEGKEA